MSVRLIIVWSHHDLSLFMLQANKKPYCVAAVILIDLVMC